MATTITKAKKKAPKLKVPQASVFDPDLASLVDEAAKLSQGLPEARKLVERYDKIRKIVQSKTEGDHAPSEEYEVHGNVGILKFAPGQEKRELTDKVALYEALGNDNFFLQSRFTLGDIDKYLTPAEIAKCVTVYENGGTRKCTAVLKEED